jgi:hypothetical protein
MKPLVLILAFVCVAAAPADENYRDKYTLGMTGGEVSKIIPKGVPPEVKLLSTSRPKNPKRLESEAEMSIDVSPHGVRLFFNYHGKLIKIEKLDEESKASVSRSTSSKQGPPTGLTVKTEKENVVASRLIGKWKTHSSLSRRLQGHPVREETIEFSKNMSVAAKVPPEYSEFLKNKQVYLAGVMTRNQTACPFILTEYNGNPYLFYFREKDGNPMGDGESMNLVITPAKEEEQDLLFIGGDFNNQPFFAFERVK